MRLRPATIADLVLLRTWDAEPHNIAAIGTEGPFDWEHEISHQSAWSEVLIAELRGRPIGVVQIIDPAREETHYWGDVEPHLRAIDIWIGAATDLGRGYGTEIMALALARCFATAGVTAVLVDPLASNVRAHRFYERLGFRRIAHSALGDDTHVYRLDRARFAAP